MTDEQQQLYDIVADWWDEVFCCNPAPLDRDGEYLDKNPTIIDLVNAIVEWKNKEVLKNFSQSSVDHYQVAYKYDKAGDPQEYRTQKHDTMRTALAAANFLDARGQYTIISVTPIYK